MTSSLPSNPATGSSHDPNVALAFSGLIRYIWEVGLLADKLFGSKSKTPEIVAVAAEIGPLLLRRMGPMSSTQFIRDPSGRVEWKGEDVVDRQGRRAFAMTRRDSHGLVVQIIDPGALFECDDGDVAAGALREVQKDLSYLRHLVTQPAYRRPGGEESVFNRQWAGAINDLVARSHHHEHFIGPLPEQPGKPVLEATDAWSHPSSWGPGPRSGLRTSYRVDEVAPPGSKHHIQTINGDLIPAYAGELDDPETKRVFVEGQCSSLAQAIHEATGWPLVDLVGRRREASLKDRVRPIHHLVETPDGNYIDVNGALSKDALLKLYSHKFDALRLEYAQSEGFDGRSIPSGVVSSQPNMPLARSMVPPVLRGAGYEAEASRVEVLFQAATSLNQTTSARTPLRFGDLS